MQVQIKFITHGACSATGAFSPGDMARVSADMAAHLVDVAKCAKYTVPVDAQDPPQDPPLTSADKPTRARKIKSTP